MLPGNLHDQLGQLRESFVGEFKITQQIIVA